MPLQAVGLYRVRKNDSLLIRTINSTTLTLTTRIRVLYDSGKDDDLLINPVNGTGDRTIQTVAGVNRAEDDGWIVGGEVSVSSGVNRGEFYVELLTTDGSAFTPICKGYVYDGHSLSVGEFVEPGPGGGEGSFRVATGANPAAGVDASDAVPSNVIWRLLAYQIALVSVAGSTAAPRLVVETPTRVRKFIGGLQDAHAGAETQTHIWGQGFGNLTLTAPTPFSDTEVISPRMEIPPNLLLIEGHIIRTLTAGTFQATDNYGAPSISVEEWLVF